MLNIPHCVLGSSHIRIVEKLLDSGLSATDLLQKNLYILRQTIFIRYLTELYSLEYNFFRKLSLFILIAKGKFY